MVSRLRLESLPTPHPTAARVSPRVSLRQARSLIPIRFRYPRPSPPHGRLHVSSYVVRDSALRSRPRDAAAGRGPAMHRLAARVPSPRACDLAAAPPFATSAAPISPRPSQEAHGDLVPDDTMPNLERTPMRALHSPRTHTANPTAWDAVVARLSARGHDLRQQLRFGWTCLLLAATALLVGGFLPSTAAAGSITGTVFEDVNYPGGAGRDKNLSHGIPVQGARIEVFDGVTGAFKGATTTGPGGTYTISENAGSYVVRVVDRSVSSSRFGFTPGLHFGVPTYRVNAASGFAVGVTNEVGGHAPAAEDGANAGSGALLDPATFQFILGPTGFAQS